MRSMRTGAVLAAAVGLAVGLGAGTPVRADGEGGPADGTIAGCPSDRALTRAAASLALEGGRPSAAALTRAVRRAGSDLPAVHALQLAPDEPAQRLRSWLLRLKRRTDAPLVCAEAQSEQGRLVLAAARGGSLAPVPGDRRLLRADLAPGFGAPRLVVRGADGGHRRIPLEEPLDAVAVPDDVALPALVQLVARGPVGPRPVAEWRLGGGARSGTMDAPQRPSRFEPWARLHRLRSAHDAGRLRPNRLLSRAAAAHAQRVCGDEPVGHELERGVDPERRLARYGLRARVVGEVVARGPSPAAALAGLEDSPSHLMTMVDSRFTDGGWGRARDEQGHSCLVIVLAAWPRF